MCTAVAVGSLIWPKMNSNSHPEPQHLVLLQIRQKGPWCLVLPVAPPSLGQTRDPNAGLDPPPRLATKSSVVKL